MVNPKQRSLYPFILMCVVLGCLVWTISGVDAQAPDELWSKPINLSQSGAAGEPRMVIDSSGGMHVLWREDAVDSFFYTRQEGRSWRQAKPVELPFGTRRYAIDLEGAIPGEDILLQEDEINEDTPIELYNPELVAGRDGVIHAFWLGEGDALYHSSVPADEFDNFDSWTFRQRLGESVLGFSAALDISDRIHLSYIDNTDSTELPAGVYHRYADGDGSIWSEPVALYRSSYFRAAEPEDVNIRVVTGMSPGDNSGVHVVMDNHAIEQVLYVSSADRGNTWQDPSVVDWRREEDSSTLPGPSDIDIVSTGETLHLSWLAGHDSNCQQYHQWSESDGRTWQPAIVIDTDSEDCPSDFRLIAGEDDLLFLLSYAGGRIYLQAWNGKEWSERENQPNLISFDDPTTHRPVNLECQQPIVDEDGNLLVVGCGSNDSIEDVWLLERPLGEESDWFSSGPTTWSEPTLLMAAAADQILEPVIFSDKDNKLHAFWLAENRDDALDINARIYYSSWTDGIWSRQVPLIHLDTTRADQLSGVFNQESDPFIFWRDVESNTYYWTTVLSERILFPAEWSVPQPLFEPDAMVTHPQAFLDRAGALNVVYAVPLNEGRGIYLKRTDDLGNTWSEPSVVVDAVGENWTMVDHPSLAQTENGDLHVVFTVYSLEPEPVAKELYYTHSADFGETWSKAELITQGNVDWGQVIGVDEKTVLITWKQKDGDETQLWSQQSVDGGKEWERPLLLLEPDDLPAVFSLDLNQPYLVQVQSSTDGGLLLQERQWSDNTWQAIEYHDLATTLTNERLLDLAADVTENGVLMILVNSEPTDQDEEANEERFNVVGQPGDQTVGGSLSVNIEPESKLFFLDRSVELPAHGASSVADVEVTQAPAPAPTPAAAPVSDSADNSQVDDTIGAEIDLGGMAAGGASGSIINSVVMSIAPAALIILFIVAAGIIRLRSKR